MNKILERQGMAFEASEQRRIMGKFATGVTVVTTIENGEQHGMTANAVASLSLDPPLVLVAVDRENQTHASLGAGKCFAVSILRQDQEDLSRRFAAPGYKDFDAVSHSTAVTGAPILDGAIGYVDCRLHEVLPGGDHDIFVGEIVAGGIGEGDPLVFFSGKYGSLAG